MKNFTLALAVAAIFGCLLPSISGCAFPEERRVRFLNANPNLDPKKRELIRSGSVMVGMTKAEVTAAIGGPQSVNETVTQFGRHEQWVHYQGYFYFTNDKLDAWQVSR